MSYDNGSVSGLRRADLARATGCNLETIRYYEKHGVLPEPRRRSNGYRVYGPEDVARLGFVMRGRELGFTLEEIKGLLDLVDGGTLSCAEVKSRAERHMETIALKIADLSRIHAVLGKTVADCHGEDRPQCAVIDALMPAG